MSRVFFDRPVDTVASFWQILRRDGVALGFTSHNRDLWFDGLLHRAAPGMVPSAIRRTAQLNDDGAEIEGALSHDTIAASDLAAGRFDSARIAIGAIDWETLEHSVLYRGSVGSVSREAGGFSAELNSAKADLDIDPLDRTSPTCRARFCDQGCTLSARRFTKRVIITGVDFDQNSVTTSAAFSSDYVDGEIRFLAGPQVGFTFAIIGEASGQLLLDQPLLEGVEIGEMALLRQGCDHTISTCANRFQNAVNFQGEPFLPGNDLIAQYPVPR
jgi:uncharacterized phage protein (TIGR02218 family)